MECKVGSFVCDIVCPNGKIIEIQTGHFANMVKKLNVLTKENIVEIVYPISIDTYVRTLDIDGTEKRIRKSPIHGCLFQLCRELSKLTHLLHNSALNLRIVYIKSLTTKIDDKKSKSRYKNPRIIEKELIEIIGEKYYENFFEAVLEMLSLLPETFCREDIAKCGYKKHSSYVIWFFKKLNLIEESGKTKNKKIYKKCI